MMMNLGRCPGCRLVGGGCCVADRLLLVPEERNGKQGKMVLG